MHCCRSIYTSKTVCTVGNTNENYIQIEELTGNIICPSPRILNGKLIKRGRGHTWYHKVRCTGRKAGFRVECNDERRPPE